MNPLGKKKPKEKKDTDPSYHGSRYKRKPLLSERGKKSHRRRSAKTLGKQRDIVKKKKQPDWEKGAGKGAAKRAYKSKIPAKKIEQERPTRGTGGECVTTGGNRSATMEVKLRWGGTSEGRTARIRHRQKKRGGEKGKLKESARLIIPGYSSQ